MGVLAISLMVSTVSFVFANGEEDSTSLQNFGKRGFLKETRTALIVTEEQKEKFQSIFENKLALKREVIQHNRDIGNLSEEQLQILEERMAKVAEMKEREVFPFVKRQGFRKGFDKETLTEEQLLALEEKIGRRAELKEARDFEGKSHRLQGFRR